MNTGRSDRFTNDIIDRLEGVEEKPRLDRDGRHGLIAVLVVTVVLLATISFEAIVDRAMETSAVGVADRAPLVTPASIRDAVDRIQVPAAEDSSRVPGGSVETDTMPHRYERIEAMAPGRRS